MTSSAAPKMLRKRDEAGNKFIVVQLSVMYWKRRKSLTILWLTIQEGMPKCYPWGKLTMKPWASSLPVWQVWRGGPLALLGLAFTWLSRRFGDECSSLNRWIEPILFNPFLGWCLKAPPKNGTYLATPCWMYPQYKVVKWRCNWNLTDLNSKHPKRSFFS